MINKFEVAISYKDGTVIGKSFYYLKEAQEYIKHITDINISPDYHYTKFNSITLRFPMEYEHE